LRKGPDRGKPDQRRSAGNGRTQCRSGLTLYARTKLPPGFDIYRIVADGLVPMVCERVPYTAAMDMPRYCNMVAINRTPRRSS